MTTTARLLALLSMTLALGACAVQQAGAAGSRQAALEGGAAPAHASPAAAAPAAPVAAPAQQADTPAPAPTAAAQAASPSASQSPAARAPGGRAAAPAAPLSSTPVQETPATAAGNGAPAAAPSPTPAAPAIAPPAGAVTMPSAPPTGSLLQTLFALVVVLAVLAALAWFLKRYGPKAGIGGGANLRVVGSLNLGGRERLLVVEVGNQWIVVGASPGRVNALATMPKQEGIESGAALAAHGPAANSFADWLKQTIDKRK